MTRKPSAPAPPAVTVPFSSAAEQQAAEAYAKGQGTDLPGLLKSLLVQHMAAHGHATPLISVNSIPALQAIGGTSSGGTTDAGITYPHSLDGN